MSETLIRSEPTLDVSPLRDLLDGDVHAPGEAGWDEARLAWNLTVDQQPAAVVLAESAADVSATIAFARATGLRVAPQGTGHGAAALSSGESGALADTILLKTERMRGVTIDPERRIARVEAGTIWIEVVEAAAEHGLAALAGSSPDVGVVGYTLGGGLSWLARKHGIGSNKVAAIEVVTASGELVRADWANEPDLFWALRGGGGNFGVVTALELELVPLSEVYAGILWFPVDRAAEILKAWRAWTEDVPEEMTSVGRILQFPPIEEIPEPVRGRSFVVVQAIWLGEQGEGERLLEPLRALGPVMDTVAPTPIRELSQLHMDPDGPAPGAGDGGMLDDVDEHQIDLLVEAVVGGPLLSLELRHLGGAVARRDSRHGALDAFEAPFIWFGVGIGATPELKEAVDAAAAQVRELLAPWEAEHTYLNFAETRRQASSLFSSASYHRLRQIKAVVDPTELIRSNHPIPPARGARQGPGSLGRVHDLDDVELRVLGCLVEKQRTTPDQYPLSLNSLRLACNQATNRDPVVDWDEATVRAGVERLSRRGWIRLASGPGSRAAKYRHLLDDALGLVPSHLALLTVLLLRGPQTPGELKGRVERLYPYGSIEEIQRALDALAEAELAEKLARRPGQSQDRWRHLLGGAAPDEPQRSTNVESVHRTQGPLEERVARLEEQVAELQRRLGGD